MKTEDDYKDSSLPEPANRVIFVLLAAILIVGALGFWVLGVYGEVNAAAETSNE